MIDTIITEIRASVTMDRADLWTRGERIWAGIDIEADLSRRKGDTPGSDRIGSDRRNERSNTGVAVEV